jgi:hypothetical protein
MKAWKCHRCGVSPKPKEDEDFSLWCAKGFIGAVVTHDEGKRLGQVSFQPGNVIALLCPSCLTAADRGQYRTLRELGRELGESETS